MNVSDFDFDLPERLIAKYPAAERTSSRLLIPSQSEIKHGTFSDIADILNAGDLLVFNDTKVVPARLYAQKSTGGKLEILFERKLGEQNFLAHIRSSKSPKPDSIILLENGIKVKMVRRHDALFELELPADCEVFSVLEALGHIPLPPYIDRQDESLDQSRYQTVYARNPGAAAAPTAGLHFDGPLLAKLRDKGVKTAHVTLHVGAGTFQPVKVDKVEEHKMHSEWIDVSQETVDLIRQTRAQGGRVVCVGTTSLRSLESASQSGEIQAMTGDTDIFIYPGYEFKTVDALITNFHLPKSTLMMLVSAFAGPDLIRDAYACAINKEYRFFSYGDAMFLERKVNS